MCLFNNGWFNDKWLAVTPIAKYICPNIKIYSSKLQNIFVPIIKYICSTRGVMRQRMTVGYTQCTLAHSLSTLLSLTDKCSKSSANVCKCCILFVQMYKYYLCKCVNVHKYHWNYSLSVTVSFTIHIIVDLVKTLVFMRWKIAWVGEEVINSKYASVSSTCPHCLPSFQSSKHGLKKQDAKCKLDNSNLGSTQQWMTLTCCQDHILTENI